MLTELKIQNIILVESATLNFKTGFHVFSGETGAGKTAILQALKLTLGAKADLDLIRKGCPKASVIACFEMTQDHLVFSLLESCGVEFEDTSIVIKRELSASGKSRAFINNQLVQLSVLKKIAPFLVEIVAQHASQQLLKPEYHLELLDAYGQHQQLNQQVLESFCHLQELQKQYDLIVQEEEEERLKRQQWQEQFDEIDEANIINADEEDTLFTEYQTLAHTQELSDALALAYTQIQDQDNSLLQLMRQQQQQLSRIQVPHPEFQDILLKLSSTCEQLSDTSYQMLRFKDSLEDNPTRMHAIEERLSLLKSLCKHYGPTLKEVIEKHTFLDQKLNQFVERTENKEKISQQIQHYQNLLKGSCHSLTKAREKAAQKLESEVAALLCELNLPQAKLFVELKPTSFGDHGQESVEFYLQANKGENKTALKDRVSGGELSRVLLALKVILAKLEATPTLVFDEVDANLGGETAIKVGRLLKTLSTDKQIITITHLPQVAVFAHHHFQISKSEEGGRTHSTIEALDQAQREKEIERMLGGSLSSKTADLAKDLIQSSKS